ncbi:MAG: HAD-IB family hydrolase [Tissierellia bacterium]|nr:HAD-IB family hydrolase [Tissierellia bacterium]
MGNIAAFFDIDGTLVRESILIKHFKKLVKYGIIDEKHWVNSIRPKYEAFERRHGDFDDYLDEVSTIYKDELIGLNKSLIDFTAQQVIDEGGEMVYRYTRERIKWHREQGHKVFFISGSPDFLVGKLAKIYEITGYKGTHYNFDENDVFQGDIIQMWDSESKQKEFTAIAEKYDLDLDNSYAYGDTNGDFSMLKRMGHAIAINPSGKLLDMIREDEEVKSKVSIIIERKDLVYEVSPDVKILDV